MKQFRDSSREPLLMVRQAQLNYNIDVVCEYIVKKIPIPERNFISLANMIVIQSFDVNKRGFEVDEIRGGVANLLVEVFSKYGSSLFFRAFVVPYYRKMKVNFFLLRRLMGMKAKGEEGQGRVSKLAKEEILMLNIGSMSTGARIVAVKNDVVKLQLMSPV